VALPRLPGRADVVTVIGTQRGVCDRRRRPGARRPGRPAGRM